MLDSIALQLDSILSNGQFSESATITIGEEAIALAGIFYSGTYDRDDAPASNVTKRFKQREFFQISQTSVGDYTDKDLIKATIDIPTRGTYSIGEVSGARCGMLTLELKARRAKSV